MYTVQYTARIKRVLRIYIHHTNTFIVYMYVVGWGGHKRDKPYFMHIIAH